MVQSRTRKWVFIILWAAMIGVAADLGLKPARGALPACEVCDCKLLTYWYTPAGNGANLGWRTVGGGNAILSAWPSVQTVKGTCDLPVWKGNVGNGDIYSWQMGFYNCAPANAVQSEITIGGNSAVSKILAATATCVPNPTGGGN